MKTSVFLTGFTRLLIVCIILTGPILYQPFTVSALEPNSGHSVDEALKHALKLVEAKYNLPGLTSLQWDASVDNTPDLSYATHHVFVNKAETLSEIQAAYAINPAHAGFTTRQVTIYVHAPDNQLFSHKISIFDGERHYQWIGTVDVDGHIAEYMHYE